MLLVSFMTVMEIMRVMGLKYKHKKAYMMCCDAFAECSDDTRLSVGSVIVKNNRIISCGYNAHTEHITAPQSTS